MPDEVCNGFRPLYRVELSHPVLKKLSWKMLPKRISVRDFLALMHIAGSGGKHENRNAE